MIISGFYSKAVENTKSVCTDGFCKLAVGAGLEPANPYSESQFSRLVPYHSAQPTISLKIF